MFQTQRISMAGSLGVAVPKLVIRQVFPLVLTLVLIWQFRHYLDQLDPVEILASLKQFELRQWGTAIVASAFSFWAIGRYDAVIHGVMGTDVTRQSAKRSGIAAIAIAQFAGFGLITGALVRWRLIPGFSLWQALRVSLTVSLSFLVAWGFITLLFASAVYPDSTNLRMGAVAAVVAGLVLVAMSLWQPGFGVRVASLRAMVSILALVLIDTFFAAAAFWAFLPAELTVPAITLFTAFLISLGAGMVGGTPGGVGPFEICLLAQLPMLGPDPMLAAALAFRMVYHVIPALLAAAYLTHRFVNRNIIARARLRLIRSDGQLPGSTERTIWQAPRAEANLFRHGAVQLLCDRDRPVCQATSEGQSLILLSDVFEPASRLKLPKIARELARRHQQTPTHYKCSGRQAVVYRKAGWNVAQIAMEAWVDTQGFDCDGPRFRQLRRMLRKAESAEIRIVAGPRSLPMTDMAGVSRQWASAHGRERGFSMGWFDPAYIANQRVFLAYRGDTLQGFITLNEVQDEWTLDLMRQLPDTPTGTMHTLMAAAITEARSAGCPRVSLAAVPCDMQHGGKVQAFFASKFRAAGGADGLQRFKSCFAPNWEPLYAAAPNRLALAVGLWDVLRQVHHPRTSKSASDS